MPNTPIQICFQEYIKGNGTGDRRETGDRRPPESRRRPEPKTGDDGELGKVGGCYDYPTMCYYLCLWHFYIFVERLNI